MNEIEKLEHELLRYDIKVEYIEVCNQYVWVIAKYNEIFDEIQEMQKGDRDRFVNSLKLALNRAIGEQKEEMSNLGYPSYEQACRDANSSLLGREL